MSSLGFLRRKPGAELCIFAWPAVTVGPAGTAAIITVIIINLNYAKVQHNHYKYSIQSIKP